MPTPARRFGVDSAINKKTMEETMLKILRGLAAALPAFAALQALTPGAASAQQPKPVSVIVFPGGFNWPIWAAQEKGYFERNGVAVTLTPTPNSAFQLTGLIDGKFDIAMTAIDNVIAYMEGQGAAKTTQAPDIIAFMGADNGFLRLITIPEVKSYADLKGKQVSVDAMTTGYAFVLRKLLEKGGLKYTDTEFVSAGGVLQRYQALMEKKHAGTLLISPFEVNAQAKGFNLLANADEALGRYQGLVGAARRSWAKENEEAVVAYIRAYIAGLDWLYDPANKADAIALLRKNLPNMSEELAAKSYEILLNPKTGFARHAELDIEGVKTVLALRSEYGEPRKQLTDAAKYYDLRYHAKARGQ
jgi:ABC-type nitrate/sulfonate/bicarbonate transport system substrate-binding protein